jgi:enterochelin esterase family protein
MFARFPIAVLAGALAVWAQAPAPRPNSYRASGGAATARARIVSPEIHADGTVTFRIRAPQAAEVSLSLGGSRRMTKDESGLWSITIGPLEPEIYEYSFLVDGARVLDTANPLLKTGQQVSANLLDVPASPPRFDQAQDVPHGAIHILSYTSTPLKQRRQLYVYTPPQYDADAARRFPVVYLRHGSGDDESTWSIEGRAGVILENLIARGKAVPAIIVMTNGDTDRTWAGGSSPEAMDLLGRELLGDVIPLVEKTYRVAPGREARAIVGLSMGGGQAFTIGLRNPDHFAWVGEFSSGLISEADFQLSKHIPGLLEKPAITNGRFKLLHLACGAEDPRLNGQLNLVDELKAHQIRHVWFQTPGAHEWKVWRHALADFLQKTFR